MKIWALGDAVIDLLPLGEMQFSACAGGAPVNVAVGAARLGCDSGFIGRTGDDPFGHFLQNLLAEQGVDTRYMQFDTQHRTSTVLVSLDDEGDRSFTFLVDPSADQFLTADYLPELGNDILHFCSLALVASACRETLVRAIGCIKQGGGLLSFDINLREQMWSDAQEMSDIVRHFARQADILKLSQEELYWLTGTAQYEKALKVLHRYPACLKVVTCGPDGSIVLWHDQVIQVSAYDVESIDTTGAGDAFMAGLLAGLALGNKVDDLVQLKQVLMQASACGALATTAKGALTALPDAKGVMAFRESRHDLLFNLEDIREPAGQNKTVAM